MKTVVWVHGDGLSPHDVALAANAGAPAVFVFTMPCWSNGKSG